MRKQLSALVGIEHRPISPSRLKRAPAPRLRTASAIAPDAPETIAWQAVPY
jgi:hypothetical protein